MHNLNYGFQLAQLVKSLVVEQGTWVQISPTPKTNWCLGLIVRATIMSGRHRFKCYHNYIKEKAAQSEMFFSYFDWMLSLEKTILRIINFLSKNVFSKDDF